MQEPHKDHLVVYYFYPDAIVTQTDAIKRIVPLHLLHPRHRVNRGGFSDTFDDLLYPLQQLFVTDAFRSRAKLASKATFTLGSRVSP